MATSRSAATATPRNRWGYPPLDPLGSTSFLVATGEAIDLREQFHG